MNASMPAWNNPLELLAVHCQGEIGKVIMQGAPMIPGASLLDKMHYLNQQGADFRRFVTLEPRGMAQMSVNLLLPSAGPQAAAGLIVLQAERAQPMSGSNVICVVTALLESGQVPMQEPLTRLSLETPAGLIQASAHCQHGRCLAVSLDNVPCFAERLDYPIHTAQWGSIHVDIAFGGVYYAIVEVAQVGLSIAPSQASALVQAGMTLKTLLREQVVVKHPLLAGINEIAYVMFRDSRHPDWVQTCTTLAPGRVDRSPCGTGSSANLATLYARGQASIGSIQRSRSIIGGEFKTEIMGVCDVAGYPAILPSITGSAWIYGREWLRQDEADPCLSGFALSDTWGPLLEPLA